MEGFAAGQLRLYDPVQRYFLYGAVLDNDAVVQGRPARGSDRSSTSGHGTAGRCFTGGAAPGDAAPGDLPFDSGESG